MWLARVSYSVRPTCLTARRAAHSVARLRFLPRGGKTQQGWWLPFGASGAVAVVGLALVEGPVLAKTPETRQEVYVWGRAQAIPTPGGATIDVLRPLRVPWFERNAAGWEKIAFGPNFGAALDKTGCIFVWGEGSASGSAVGPVAVDVQGAAKKFRFSDVQCSSSRIVVLTSRGHVFWFDPMEAFDKRSTDDSGSGLPLKLQGDPVPGLPRPGWFGRGGIRQMSIGLEHAGFVSSKGELFMIGGSQWGQCGIEPPRQKGVMGALEERERIEVTWPLKVEFPETAGPIDFVQVGGRHTVVMDKDGRTFSFGDDRRIQLGLGDTRSSGTDDRHSLGVLNRDNLGGMKAKAEIKRHANYRYYDPHMQSSPVETLPPKAYNRPPYPLPSLIACGEDFTVAMHRDSPDWYEKADETNIIFCCGENSFGQCGRGLQEQQQAWNKVRLPKRSRTATVACGQGHSLALMSTGDLYGWGANFYGQVGTGSRACKERPVKISLLEPPAPVAPTAGSTQAAPVAAPVPEERRGQITHISCGFRNSAVILEVQKHD